jgi:hypothetical protein
MADDHSPRRRFPRLRSQHTILFERVEFEAEESLAKTTAVGLGGLSFVTEHEVQVGARLRLFVALRSEVVEAEAQVVWAKRLDGPGCEVGVSFISVPLEHVARIAALFEPVADEAASAEVAEAAH